MGKKLKRDPGNAAWDEYLEVADIPKHEGAILDAVLRGHDIEQELLDAIHVLYEVKTAYVNRRWYAAECREGVFGDTIMNPKTDGGHFPHLSALLKWCKENRS